ncbi:MAG TPA: hypothetical protein VMT10_00195 [Solirubrobacteraceae bacterium]|nr:hypothetical protein [Solirubrobacteraceae bacterium]
MAPPTATQRAWRARIEAMLRVAGPALDLVLAAGDRLSRVVDRRPPLPETSRPVTLSPQRTVGPGPAQAPGA